MTKSLTGEVLCYSDWSPTITDRSNSRTRSSAQLNYQVNAWAESFSSVVSYVTLRWRLELPLVVVERRNDRNCFFYINAGVLKFEKIYSFFRAVQYTYNVMCVMVHICVGIALAMNCHDMLFQTENALSAARMVPYLFTLAQISPLYTEFRWTRCFLFDRLSLSTG